MKDLAFFLKLMDKHRLWLIAGGVCALITLFAQIILLAAAGWFISASAVAGAAALAGAYTFNMLGPSSVIRGSAFTRTVFRYFDRVLSHEATFRALAEIRVWIFERAIPLAPGRLDFFRSGDLLSRITKDIDALDNLYLRITVPTIIAGVTGLVLLILLGSFSLLMALGVLIAFGAAGIVVPLLAYRASRASALALAEETQNLRTDLVDLTKGWTELEVYGQMPGRLETATNRHAGLIETQRALMRVGAASTAATGLLTQLALALTLIIGLGLVETGGLTGPLLALLAFFVLGAFEAVTTLPPAFQMLEETKRAAGRLREMAGQTPTVQDPPLERAVAVPADPTLAFERVRFSYPDRPEAALEEASLELSPGAKVAILGESGSGKSTLLSLALRFYDPTAGRILLGGLPVTDMRAAAVRQRMALLSQRTDLFSATLRENLKLARPEAGDEDLRAALDEAGLTPLLNRLPEGLDTHLGEGGVNLSGGEARRVALARVYLKNAPILLLDEPTEGLDQTTERLVVDRLLAFAANRTVLLVTHRPVMLDRMDRVYAMEAGRLSLLEELSPLRRPAQ